MSSLEFARCEVRTNQDSVGARRALPAPQSPIGYNNRSRGLFAPRTTHRALTRIVLLCALLLAFALPVAAQDAGEAGEASTSLTIADNLLDRTFAAYDARNYDQALLDVSLYVLLNPTAAQGYYFRALVQMARQQPDSALGDLERALDLADSNLYNAEYRAGLLTTRAGVLQGMEDVEGAREAYAQSLETAPSIDAYTGRALLSVDQGEFEAAVDDLDAAIALAPQEQIASLYLFRASVHTQAGDDEAASDYLTYVQNMANDVQEGEPLVAEEVVEFEIAAGRVYALPFQATEGDLLTAAAAADEAGGVDPLLVLLAADGTALAANDDRAPDDLRAVIGDFPIPADGTYVLLLTHSGGGDTGTVRVAISLGSPSP